VLFGRRLTVLRRRKKLGVVGLKIDRRSERVVVAQVDSVACNWNEDTIYFMYGGAMIVKRMCAVILSVFGTSCIAFEGYGDRQTTVTNPLPAPQMGRLRSQVPAEASSTCAEFRDAWGAPDIIEESSDGTVLWTFRRGLRWNGFFMSIIIIPFGLAWPSGFDSVTLTCREGRVLEASALCGGRMRFSFWFGPPSSSCAEAYVPTWTVQRESTLELDEMFVELRPE
jgi:hypothetical protein